MQDKIRKFAENLKGREQVESVKGRLPRAAKRLGNLYLVSYAIYIYHKTIDKLLQYHFSDQINLVILGLNVF